MTLPDNSTLKQRAAEMLAPHQQQAKKLILIHTGAILALNFLVLLLSVLLERGISTTGGLRGIQLRSILSTAQAVLEFGLMIVLPFWQISWLYMILKFARGNCAQPNDLFIGFQRFRPVLRLSLLKGLIFFGLIFAGVYAGYFVILATPLADPLMEAMMSTADEEAMYLAFSEALTQLELPIMLIGSGISLLLCAPFFYRFRQAEYFLMDHPKLGARVALRASRQLMRGNGWRMVKLDLSYWWFWILSLLVMVVSYADMLLPKLGFSLPLPDDILFLAAFALSVPLQLLLYRSCKVQVDATYAAAYLSLIPPEQPPTPVAFPANTQ